MKNMESHDFYCICCGNKSLPIWRKVGHQHQAFHRKKLWCPTCKIEVNCIECRTYDEVCQFKEDYANGVYKEEADAEVVFARRTGWQR